MSEAHLFRVVYAADTHFRLMETSGAGPATWKINMNIEGTATDVLVRDIVTTDNDVPTHRGMDVQVVVPASDIQNAVVSADRAAQTVLSLQSAAARAPIHSLQPFVAYDITPGATARLLMQWFPTPEFPTAKTAVPADAFRLLHKGLHTLSDQRLSKRLHLSIDWHRAAVRETEPLFRFLSMWAALEAVGNPVSEKYAVDVRGWHGLRCLAQDRGRASEVISEVLDVRRHLMHDLSVRPADIRPRAQRLVPVMEDLVIAAWALLLGAPQAVSDFPKSSVTAHPMRQVFKVILLDEDEAQ
ncbi:MAG: hypothetical protein ACRDI2_03205 [Chloroflexota bacterium]